MAYNGAYTGQEVDDGIKYTQGGNRAVIAERQTSGTNGGDFTSGAWRTRKINNEEYDPDTIVTLGADASPAQLGQFTLQAGTYRIQARAPGYKVNRHKLRLQNITDGSTTLLGENAYTNESDLTATHATVEGYFTIAGTKTFEIQHQCNTTKSTDGFGVAASFSVDEIYAFAVIEKLA